MKAKRDIFKTLVFANQYVDTRLLEKGIYPCTTPRLFDRDETMDSIIERLKWTVDINGKSFVPDSYFENLKRCSLVDIVIFLKQTNK